MTDTISVQNDVLVQTGGVESSQIPYVVCFDTTSRGSRDCNFIPAEMKILAPYSVFSDTSLVSGMEV